MVMLNSGMERITDIGTLPSRFQDREEEKMVTRFHGIDRHKKYSTVSVLDRDGKEVQFLRSCAIEDYLSELGSEDAVVLEASCGCFYWADQIETTGAICYVLDPRRFRIITDSWNKTDRQDARNMAKALWVFLVTGEFGIPTVYKPSHIGHAVGLAATHGNSDSFLRCHYEPYLVDIGFDVLMVKIPSSFGGAL